MSYCDGDRLVCLVGEDDLGRVVGLEFRLVGVFLSATAVAQAETTVVDEIVSGGLSVRQVAAEDLVFAASRGELYDIVFAVCVGALDDRYPEVGQLVPRRIAMVTKANARFFADGGNPLREPPIPWC